MILLHLQTYILSTIYTHLTHHIYTPNSTVGPGTSLHLSLCGGEFSHETINGSVLPLLVEFSTLHPNGLLLYAHGQSAEVSHSVAF